MASSSGSIMMMMMIGLMWWMMAVAPTAVAIKDATTRIEVMITNNHTNYLSVRCYSFNNDYDAQHLKPNQSYKFGFSKRFIFASATMFNCSTNMGAFIAYKYDYECGYTGQLCTWKFDENKTYLYLPVARRWKGIDYNPNYESLTRGGVVKGYYSN